MQEENQEQQIPNIQNPDKPNFLAVQTPSDQIKDSINQQKSQSQNFQEAMLEDQKYIGLCNIGATCYMNSVLQSLFMTPEFRESLYNWKYNPDDQVEEDCIPFQLQKLFAKLQTKFNSFIDTKELIKSFQWDQYQAFEQHDVQEFIRILFDALETTFKTSQQDQKSFIKNLYMGKVKNYIKCTECGYESMHEENYNDIIVTVKNIFDKIYNESLEKGLQRYLKPEILEGDNAYQCETCNKKVKAEKGCKFTAFPKILTVILNRFTFDFFTMQRIKLNDFVKFPFILNLNNYINGYEGIKDKLSEENVDPKYFENDIVIKPTSTQIKKQKMGGVPVAKGKVGARKGVFKSAKPSQTSDFIKNMRKQKMQSQSNNDVLILESNSNTDLPPKIIYSKIEQKMEEEEENQNKQKQESNDENENNKKEAQTQVLDKEKQLLQMQTKNNAIEQQQQKQSENISKEKTENNEKYQLQQQEQNLEKESQTQKKEEEEQLLKQQKILEEREKIEKELIEAFNKHEQENRELIKKYKVDGDLVYELYSILVHTGGAYGGHYYVLIKSFEDKKWYNFNDTRVTQFDLRQILEESYGGNAKNAYMLFYRQLEDKNNNNTDQEKNKENTQNSENPKQYNLHIPDYISQLLEKEKIKVEQQEELQKEQSQLITVRVFFKLDVKLITLSKKSTLQDLLEKSIDEFKIDDIYNKPEQANNIRLRSYKPQTDTMQETYTNKQKQTLDNLKIGHFKNLCIEIKQELVEFEEFDMSLISLKLCQWQESITSLDERCLELQKIKARKDSLFSEFLVTLSQHTQIPVEQLSVSQKHQTHGFACAEVLTSNEKNKDLLLEELNIFENCIIYYEEVKKGIDLNWPKEFETEQHRVTIKFNTPSPQQQQQLENNNSQKEQEEVQRQKDEYTIIKQEFPHTLIIDSRLTVTDLKQKICNELQLDHKQIILRRGGKQGQEIKEGKTTSLKGQQFFNGSSVYLEYGRPARDGEVRLIISYATPADLQNDTSFYEFLEVGEFPISSALNAFQAAQLLCTYIKEILNIDIDPKLVRLRERISNRLSKVYRNKPLKDQQLIDKKMISVEKIGFEQNLSIKQFLVYIRIFNSETWELSDRFELVIVKSESGFELAKAIYEIDQSIEIDNMEATRINAIWNFNKYDLMNADFSKVNNPDIMLGSQPFHIMNDGYMLVIKDSKKEIRELNQEELDHMGVIVAKHQKPGKRGSGYKFQPYQQPKEKSLSITVVKKKQSSNSEKQQQQQQQQQDLEQQQQDHNKINYQQKQHIEVDEKSTNETTQSDELSKNNISQ